MKPAILCVGSCITENVAEALRSSPILEEKFEILFSSGNGERNENCFSQDELSRCVLSIQDLGPWQGDNLLCDEEVAAMANDVPIIRIPGLHMSTMWPFLTEDPRNEPEPGLPWGRFPLAWTDKIALDVIREVPDPADRFDAYMAINPLEHVNLSRLHEMQIVDMVQREKNSDIKIAAIVASQFRKQRLFYVFHHPGGEMFNYILSQIVLSDKFSSVHRTSLPSIIDELVDWSRQSGVFKNEQMPVHPVIAGELGLEWWSRDLVYKLAYKYWTFDSYMEDYLSRPLPETIDELPIAC